MTTNNHTLPSHLRLCSLYVASYDSQGLRWRYSNSPPHGEEWDLSTISYIGIQFVPHRKQISSSLQIQPGHWGPITIHYRLIWDCVPPSSPLTTRRDYGGVILTRLHTGISIVTRLRTGRPRKRGAIHSKGMRLFLISTNPILQSGGQWKSAPLA
jgi:hypothetical protein